MIEPYAGSISFAAPSVRSHGIPNSASRVLRAGHPVTATITVTNTGNSAKDFFADARRSGRVRQELLGSDVNHVALPLSSAVSASSGDVWAQSVDPSATYTPVHLGPGQAGTITLTFTPNAPKGTVVRGFIGVDTLNLGTDAGDELINIPYTYKVG